MNPEIKALWVGALNSGEYEQGEGSLNKDGKYCCLGVLCDVAVKNGLDIEVGTFDDLDGEGSSRGLYTTYDDHSSLLPGAVRVWAGMETSYGQFSKTMDHNSTLFNNLTTLNDHGVPFSEIAEIIDREF